MLDSLEEAVGRTVSWPPRPTPRPEWHAAWVGYVLFGAGAIGAVVGGRLFQAGFEVTLIARGVHLQALQTNGLRLESPAGTETVATHGYGALKQSNRAEGGFHVQRGRGEVPDG
jgi:hypothetical protein